MKSYYYHPETKTYMGEGQADPNPMRKGDWLIPAFATTVEPPKVNAGQVAKFIDGQWVVENLPPEDPIESPELTGEQKIELHNAEIKFQIAVIEEKQHRAIREVLLGQTESMQRLQDIEEQIKQLRAELK